MNVSSDIRPAAAVRLLAISGSLRRASHSTAVLRHMATLLPADAQQRLFTLEEIPPYDGDVDGPQPPAAVAELKDAIAQADGLVICSPEYNYGMPGVLKNAIDWASRPAFASPLKGKPALVITASPGALGGVRAQAQIRDALAATLARPLSRPHVAVPLIASRFQDGQLSDATTLEMLQAALADLLAEIRLLAAARG
ncbi:NADPH-dependent FMN reductase [Pseudacidovorax intermedius]|uniref:Chromate reductase n=1 Tax=Pseudacidovorax intermedius TaxID=433924 RepID=A0A370FGP0_9BURK|nr:NAD(P)H-dependent oxidoreductase [Pseudacidovorax intermedius]RDI25123.1 chromate reductase [Pseudacidovorax intermedius]